MDETARLDGANDCFEVGFVKREATPESAMKLGIGLHLTGLSLSDTISVLERMSVDRCRSTVHNWIQEADLQSTEGADPDYVAVDETVIQRTTSDTGCTLLSIPIRTACSTSGCFRREHRR